MLNDRRRENLEGSEELPSEVVTFLQDVIQDSVLRWDILRFFYQNPYAILTVSDLSIWVAREERPLSDALQQLAALGYLAKSYASSALILTQDGEKRRQIEEFFDYLEANPEVSRRMRARLRRQTEVE